MTERCRRCRSEPRKGAVFCDQCGVRLGASSSRGERALLWLLATVALVAASAMIITLVWRPWGPGVQDSARAEIAVGVAGEDRQSPAGGYPTESLASAGDLDRAIDRAAPTPPATAEPGALGVCVFEVPGQRGRTPHAAGGAVLEDGRAILPLSLVLGATGIAGTAASGGFEVDRILWIDTDRDLALAAISRPVASELSLAERATSQSGLLSISPLRGSRSHPAERPIQPGSTARLGDLFVSVDGVLEGLTTAPARSRELRGGAFTDGEPQLEAVTVADAQWEAVDLDLAAFHERVYAESIRGMFELATSLEEAGELRSAWFTIRKLLGSVRPDGLPGLTELHHAVLFGYVDELETALPGSSLSILNEAMGTYPMEARILGLLGQAQARNGQHALALATLRQAAVLASDNGRDLLPDVLSTHVGHLEDARTRGVPREAASELERSISSLPRNGSLHYLLALAYMDQGFLDSALTELSTASGLTASLGDEIEAARKEIERRSQPGTTVVLEFPPSATAILVDVTLNDRRTATLILDTGATRTALSPAIAQALGLKPSNQTIQVNTAGGAFEAPTVYLASLSLQSLRIESLEPVLLDLPPSDQHVDGLLGNDFLRNFRLTLDHDRGTLTLTPR